MLKAFKDDDETVVMSSRIPLAKAKRIDAQAKANYRSRSQEMERVLDVGMKVLATAKKSKSLNKRG